jgi:hypothetical protein
VARVAVAVLLVLALAAACVGAYVSAWRSGRPASSGGRAPGGARSDRDAAALWRRRQDARRRRVQQARQRALPPLPAADTPPPGLAPLVPSPRTVRLEAARGIRDLESWLADQPAA